MSTRVQSHHTHIAIHKGNNFKKQTLTRCSAIAEKPRCRVRYSFRQK